MNLFETFTDPFILGAINAWNDVFVQIARDDNAKHPYEWQGYKHWRFVPDLGLLSWWETPDDGEKITVEDWLEKHGYEVKFRSTMQGKLRFKEESIKTPKGTIIKRYKNNVGKQVGPQIYVHKKYAKEVIPVQNLKYAAELLKQIKPWFKFNSIMFNKETGEVRFDESPDFDTAREPHVGKYLSIYPNGTTREGHSNSIWHHKWLWVKDDYPGFNVEQSKQWSQTWISKINGIAKGTDSSFSAQLNQVGLKERESPPPSIEYFGLGQFGPNDELQFKWIPSIEYHGAEHEGRFIHRSFRRFRFHFNDDIHHGMIYWGTGKPDSEDQTRVDDFFLKMNIQVIQYDENLNRLPEVTPIEPITLKELTKDIDVNKLQWEMEPWAKHPTSGMIRMDLDVKKVDDSWKTDPNRFYVGFGGAGSEHINKPRYEGFKDFLLRGEPIIMPYINYSFHDNCIQFGNGRHRFAVLRDMGLKKIPAMVPKSQEKFLRKYFTEETVLEKIGEEDPFRAYNDQKNRFKQWFGNSVIVDRNGEPKVMYHGSRENNLTQFDRSTFQKNEPLRLGEGFYFTDNPDYALEFTRDSNSEHSKNRLGEYYLQLENPAPEKLVTAWREKIWAAEQDAPNREEGWKIVRYWAKVMREDLESKDYDGFIAIGHLENNDFGEVVVFRPQQIKSVNNDGTWSDVNPNVFKESDEENDVDSSTKAFLKFAKVTPEEVRQCENFAQLYELVASRNQEVRLPAGETGEGEHFFEVGPGGMTHISTLMYMERLRVIFFDLKDKEKTPTLKELLQSKLKPLHSVF